MCNAILSVNNKISSDLLEQLKKEKFDVVMAENFDYCGFGLEPDASFDECDFLKRNDAANFENVQSIHAAPPKECAYQLEHLMTQDDGLS